MGEILIGTCSWTDPTLVRSGRFYPGWARYAESRLRYYSTQFRLVEVDSSYYALPNEKTSRLWAERTEEGFVFDVKSFRLLTQHPTPLVALPPDVRDSLPEEVKERKNVYHRDLSREMLEEVWRRFESALLPLQEANKLGLIMLQFPPWFFPGREQREYIIACRQKLARYRVAVEFRHGSWMNEKNEQRTLDFLRDTGLTLVCVDEPQGFKTSLPPLAVPTADVGVVRFHGRNTETWEKKGIGAADRFNYLYNEDELEEWVPKVREMAEKTQQLHVLFNNCHEDKAVVNARQLGALLAAPLAPAEAVAASPGAAEEPPAPATPG